MDRRWIGEAEWEATTARYWAVTDETKPVKAANTLEVFIVSG